MLSLLLKRVTSGVGMMLGSCWECCLEYGQCVVKVRWRTMTAFPFVTLWLTLSESMAMRSTARGRPPWVTRKLHDTDQGARRRVLGVVRCRQGQRGCLARI